MSTSPSLPKVALIVVVFSSLISLLCTALVILRPLFELHRHRLRTRGGNNSSSWQTNRMAPSPQPSQLTRPSVDALMAWSRASTKQSTEAGDDSNRPIIMLKAAFDHLSQLIFLALVVSILLQSGKEMPLDLLNHRGSMFVCAFVLSLRLLLPLSITLFKAAIGFKKQQTNGTRLVVLTLPALVLAVCVAILALIASIFGSQAAACILLISFVSLCLSLNTFVALRLMAIQQRAIPILSKQQSKGKQADDVENDEYLASTMNTAGTKASSANPYDTRGKDMIADEKGNKAGTEGEGRIYASESEHSITTIANDSKEISSLWLDQSAPLRISSHVPHTYHNGTFDDEILLTPPPSASFHSLDGGAPLSPPETGLDRGGGRLRVSPSAREIMGSLSTSLDFYEPAISIDLQSVLITLAGMWLISILCIPLLIAGILFPLPTLPTQILTLCFIVGMAVSGPLITLQAVKTEQRYKALPSAHRISFSPLPRPSFASSLITGRHSKPSSYSISHQECPVAGNGFEPVNGYDYPFSPCLPGSYESDKRVKSVAYSSSQWTSGAISGDRVVSSQGILGRAANMMSPKPKLQVLSTKRDGKGSGDTMASRMSSKISICFDDDGEGQSTEIVVQDISVRSAIMPGAMPLSPGQDASYRSMNNLHRERRIDTIYEVDVSLPRTSFISEDGSPGMPRGAQGTAYSPFLRFTSTLRKRRASLSETDWVKVSPNPPQKLRSGRNGRYESEQVERRESSDTSQSLSVHRSSVSMSIVHDHSNWSHEAEAHELGTIPDASCSDADMADMSICSYFSIPSSDADITATTTDFSVVSQVKGQSQLENTKTEAGGKRDELKGCQKKNECDDESPNWKVISSPSIVKSPPQADADLSIVSTHSLASVMGIADDAVRVDHSTPLRGGTRLESSQSKTTEGIRKSLCSEMGFPAASPTQGSSPCRTSSDLSSLHHRRLTLDTISDSFMSSGVDEELNVTPDVTPERTGKGEMLSREIIVVELDESLPLDSQSGEVIQAEQIAVNEYAFSTQRYYQEGGNYLDPVEEVTEEPTIPISEYEDLEDDWVCNSIVDEEKPSIEAELKLKNQQFNSNTPVRLSCNAAEDWARLHGFATPSSFAYSPQSQYGWAEVIEAGKQTPLQMSIQRRSRYSPPVSPLSRSRLDSHLSAQTRAYLASRLNGTPSRLIGLQTKFWLNSPPNLSLNGINSLQHSNGMKSKRGSLMISMSPSACLGEESSWVDGAIAEDEAVCAHQEMEKNEKKWRRMSKSITGGDVSVSQGSPVNGGSRRGGRQRSSGSLQSIIDAAVKRGSIAFKGSQQHSRVGNSNRSSLASQMTLPSITISSEDGEMASLENRSDVKVVGSCISSPPSTPRRKSRSDGEAIAYANGKAPSKSGGSGKSRSSSTKDEPESPSSGKGTIKIHTSSASPNHRHSPASSRSRKAYKVHSRKESRVRETIKLMEQQQQQRSQMAAEILQVTSPRKKIQIRELTLLPASPGKFQLLEATFPAAFTAADVTSEANKEKIAPAPLLKRINRSSRFNLRKGNPQIFVRPPSGSSTHTQHLLY